MENRGLKLVTLNIEGYKHFDSVIPFLKHQNADVICLQEVWQKDIHVLEFALKMRGYFAPLHHMIDEKDSPSSRELWGMLILTNRKPVQFAVNYYVESKDSNPDFIWEDPETSNRALLIAEIKKDKELFRIITTHFTWSPNGQSTPKQYKDLGTMIDMLSTYDGFVLCGDFNAPRGRDIWNKIKTHYHDNIPQNILTTLDPNLHRIKNLNYVVDGIFSTPQYLVKNVQVTGGLSDHQAVTAQVFKK